MPTGQKPTKSAALLYAERTTRTLTSMRQEFGRLTMINNGVITFNPSYPHKDADKVWLAHVPREGLIYYYEEGRDKP